MDRVKRIWYLSPMRAAKVQASLRIRAVSPEPPLLAHTSSESRGTFRQKARSLAPLNGWACTVKVCHDGMLEDTNSLDGAHMWKWNLRCNVPYWGYETTRMFFFFFFLFFFCICILYLTLLNSSEMNLNKATLILFSFLFSAFFPTTCKEAHEAATNFIKSQIWWLWMSEQNLMYYVLNQKTTKVVCYPAWGLNYI